MAGTVELHGRKEIEDFFRDEPEGRRLDEWVDFVTFQAEGLTVGLPTHYVINGREVVVRRKAREVVIYRT